MGTYHWVSARASDSYPGGGASAPAWIQTTGAPSTLLTVPSPSGPGDVLERVEVAGWIGVQIADISVGTRSYLPAVLETLLLGEVTTGGTPPDPSSAGEYEFAFTANMDWSSQLTNLSGIVPTVIANMRATTGGYVTSKAKRGPAKYGSGSPEFVLVCHTENESFYNYATSGLSSWWGFYARCLWYVP